MTAHRRLIDFEFAAASIAFAVAHFYFAFDWVVSVLLGLSAFVLIPLLVLIMKRFKE